MWSKPQMNLLRIFSLLFFLLTLLRAVEAQPLCSYNAKISDSDKKNSAGSSLMTAGVNKASLAAIIRQDRANFHQFKIRDPEDEADCIFSDKQARAKIEDMINSSSIDVKLIKHIVTNSPVITVTIYEDKLAITLAGTTNAPEGNQAGKGVSPRKQNSSDLAKTNSTDSPQSYSFLDGLKKNVEYAYYDDGSCRPSEKKACLSLDDYKKACAAAKSVTKFAITVRAQSGNHDEKILLTGGSIDSIKILWGKSTLGVEQCYAIVSASGIVDGNSKRVDAQGVASTFIKNDAGEISITYFSLW
jgi:hypothetical protein